MPSSRRPHLKPAGSQSPCRHVWDSTSSSSRPRPGRGRGGGGGLGFRRPRSTTPRTWARRTRRRRVPRRDLLRELGGAVATPLRRATRAELAQARRPYGIALKNPTRRGVLPRRIAARPRAARGRGRLQFTRFRVAGRSPGRAAFTVAARTPNTFPASWILAAERTRRRSSGTRTLSTSRTVVVRARRDRRGRRSEPRRDRPDLRPRFFRRRSTRRPTGRIREPARPRLPSRARGACQRYGATLPARRTFPRGPRLHRRRRQPLPNSCCADRA